MKITREQYTTLYLAEQRLGECGFNMEAARLKLLREGMQNEIEARDVEIAIYNHAMAMLRQTEELRGADSTDPDHVAICIELARKHWAMMNDRGAAQ